MMLGNDGERERERAESVEKIVDSQRLRLNYGFALVLVVLGN